MWCGKFFFFIQSILYWPISFNLVQKFCLLLLQTWIEFYHPLSVFIVQCELNFSWWCSFIVREHNKNMLYSSSGRFIFVGLIKEYLTLTHIVGKIEKLEEGVFIFYRLSKQLFDKKNLSRLAEQDFEKLFNHLSLDLNI